MSVLTHPSKDEYSARLIVSALNIIDYTVQKLRT